MQKSKFTFPLLSPLPAILVFVSSLMGCSSPVQLQSPANLIEQLPQSTIAVQTTEGTFTLNTLSNHNNSGTTPYIFVHGTPGSAEGWSDFLINAPQGKNYIAIDRFGFGTSEPKGAVTSLKTHAQAIGAILDRHEAPAILIGHSLGGPIVAQAAIDYPDKIAAIIIVAGALDPQLEKILFIQRLGKIWPFSKILPRQIKNANDELIALKDELIRLQEELPRLTVPTIIVHGSEDPLVPYENVNFMQRHFTNVERLEVITLQGKGHFLPWDSYDSIVAAIELAENMVSP